MRTLGCSLGVLVDLGQVVMFKDQFYRLVRGIVCVCVHLQGRSKHIYTARLVERAIYCMNFRVTFSQVNWGRLLLMFFCEEY